MKRDPAYFSDMFERMISMMTDPDSFDRQRFVEVLSEICIYFGITKGVTEFYRSPEHERLGDGERLVDFDNGRGEKILHRRRIITRTNAIIMGTLYVASDEPPLSNEDLEKVDLILRALLSFVSRNRLQHAVEQLGFHDDFGYPNIRFFFHTLWKMNESGKLDGCCAVRYNLLHFSLVNRDMGRNAGDAIIRSHYQYIQDIIGSGGVVCRMGGDNFIAVFGRDVLDDIVTALRGIPISLPDNTAKRIMIKSTAGIFIFPDGFSIESVDDVMDKVSPAASAAKQSRENIIFYNDRMEVLRDDTHRIQMQFRTAVERKDFCAFYQPKVDVDTGEIVGAEALCRWHHDGKVVFPAEFIPVLEQNSDICILDMYMLDTVCRDIRRWLDSGLEAVRVSVNLSRKNLMDIDLLENIQRIIDSHNVPHEYIEIELTETTSYVEFDNLRNVVCGLRSMGISASIDDFGIGYSSLNLLSEIPWSVIKVDRSFLPSGEDKNCNSDVMFRHVVSMALELGFECIAEGVETPAQIELLKENKCHLAQGFIFDRPLPAEEFEQKLGGFRYTV